MTPIDVWLIRIASVLTIVVLLRQLYRPDSARVLTVVPRT